MTFAYGLYSRSLGRPLFILMLLVMIPLATTELGTDSWITSLMEPEMTGSVCHPGWVLIYTSALMLILQAQRGTARCTSCRQSDCWRSVRPWPRRAVGDVIGQRAADPGRRDAVRPRQGFLLANEPGFVAEQFPRGVAQSR